MNNRLQKIVMYIDIFGQGGAQRVMANLADFFTQKGVQVVLVNDFPLCVDEAQYHVSKKIERIYLKETNEGNPIVKNLQRVLSLRKIVKEEKPDLVLSFLGRPNMRMLLATMGLKNKKVVSVRNDPNMEYGTGVIRKNAARLLFLLSDGCVFQTEDAKKYFFDVTQRKSKIIFNPVGNSFYGVERAENPENIVSVGRFEPQKNHKLLMRAFKEVAEQFPEEKLIIYGTGRLKQEYENLRRELGLENKIIFPGSIDDVSSKLAKAKIFVLSSDYEGMPNALMEAMAMGLPCISTDCPCGGPKELITDGEDGLLVKVNDLDGLCNAIQKLLNSEETRVRLGNAAKFKAESFCQERIMSQWEDYFQQVISES